MQEIIGLHRIDHNLGDSVSSPIDYFNFFSPSRKVDILSIEDGDLRDKDIIFGGGGLMDEWFFKAINRLQHTGYRKLIAWGIGQQLDRGPWYREYPRFDYLSYLGVFDLTGIRDYGFDFRWVPCASCMHPSFDKERKIEHEFVVYSHNTRPLPIMKFPRMSNEVKDFEEVLDFLASGQTIITSSYHGAYWGLLLKRKVLAFPFNSKFFTFKHLPSLYPAIWKRKRSRFTFKKTSIYELDSVKGWRFSAGSARVYPEALEECRQANREYYREVIQLLKEKNG